MRITFFASIFAVLLLASCGGNEKQTPNGFNFVKYKDANGRKPKAEEFALVHVYMFYDDSLVNSTRAMNRPMPISVPDFANTKPEDLPGGKPSPLIDVLSVMGVGDSVMVEAPIDEQARNQTNLKNVQKLTYAVVLEDVMTKEEFEANQNAERQAQLESQQKAAGPIAELVATTAKKYTSGDLKGEVKTLPSGLKYQILEPGTGDQAVPGKKVDVNYYGVLTNGTRFDDSFSRGRPFSFELGKGMVIKGWDEGIALLKEGGKGFLFVPAELGYGAADRGTIPPNSELIFYVELIDVK